MNADGVPDEGGGWSYLVCRMMLAALEVKDGGFLMMLVAGVSAMLVEQHARAWRCWWLHGSAE